MNVIRVGIVGLGKMGLSHYAIANATSGARVTAVCDTSSYVLGVVQKYGNVSTFTSLEAMLSAKLVDAVIISTPNHLHASMVRTALEAGVDVFCEKPFSLSFDESRDLAKLADELERVSQVGYHYRFVGAFAEAKRLLDEGAIGKVSRVLAEAYGPVVLKPSGRTWRSDKRAGGGALYDYAAHPINLLNWFFGEVDNVSGTILNKVFSRDTDDEVITSLRWRTGVVGQLSVSWSDESQRKMSTKISVWGDGGRITVDRQECQVFLRADREVAGYNSGWTVKYTTELTTPVGFYVRGEEYSAQLEQFVSRCQGRVLSGPNDFISAASTDRVLELLIRNAGAVVSSTVDDVAVGGSEIGAQRRGAISGVRKLLRRQ